MYKDKLKGNGILSSVVLKNLIFLYIISV